MHRLSSTRNALSLGAALLVACCGLAVPVAAAGTDVAAGEWTAIGPFGGRAMHLASDPFVTDRVWAHANQAGLFVSDDRGHTWAARHAGLPSLGVTAVAIDPATRGRMWVAAGGLGVFRSDADGRDWVDDNWRWRRLGFRDVPAVYALLFDPAVAGRLLALTNQGLHEMSVNDPGAVWSEVAPGLAGLERLAADSRRAGVLYAAGAGFVRSTDGGKTFRAVDGLGGTARVLALHVSRSSKVGLWVSFGDGVFHSEDGASWLREERGLVGPKVPGGRATVFAFGDDPATDATYAVTSAGLYRRVATASSWEDVNAGVAAFESASFLRRPEITLVGRAGDGVTRCASDEEPCKPSNDGLFARNCAQVAVDPSGAVFALCDGSLGSAGPGLWRWRDGEWAVLTPPVGLAARVAASRSGIPVVLVAGADEVAVSRDQGASWHGVPVALGGQARAAEIAPSNTAAMAVAGPSWLVKSEDGGASWVRVQPARWAGGFDAGRAVTLAFAPYSSRTVYVTDGTLVARSDDGGATWSESPTDNGLPRTCPVPVSPGFDDVLQLAPVAWNVGGAFAAMRCTTGLWASRDGGAWWEPASGPTESFRVAGLATLMRPARLFVAAVSSGIPEGPGVWYSDAGSVAWKRLDHGLPASPHPTFAPGLAAVPTVADRVRLALATSSGVLVRDDALPLPIVRRKLSSAGAARGASGGSD